jgi:hypothetical protein
MYHWSLSGGYVAAHFPQAISVIAPLADGQKIAILGIEDEQKPIEKDQGCVADFLQRGLGRGGGDRLGERRKYAIEHQLGDAVGDTLLIKPAFVDCPLVKRLCIGWRRQERLAPKYKDKNLQPMTAALLRTRKQPTVMIGNGENSSEIDLKKLLRNGSRPLVVKTPAPAICEDAPAELASGEVIHTA